MATRLADGSILMSDGRRLYANSVILAQDLVELMPLFMPSPAWPFMGGGGSGQSFINNTPGANGQGPQGFQGQNGAFGGPQGNQGFQGFFGDEGFQGPQGNVGSGVQGPQGTNPGVQGPQGFQGFQGFQGPGLQGLQGFQGIQGLQGTNPGVQGPQGLQGFQGIDGFGPQGFQGIQGLQGTNPGVQGPQGFQGFQGNGPQGFQGAIGAQGEGGLLGFQAQDIGGLSISAASGLTDLPLSTISFVLPATTLVEFDVSIFSNDMSMAQPDSGLAGRVILFDVGNAISYNLVRESMSGNASGAPSWIGNNDQGVRGRRLLTLAAGAYTFRLQAIVDSGTGLTTFNFTYPLVFTAKNYGPP